MLSVEDAVRIRSGGDGVACHSRRESLAVGALMRNINNIGRWMRRNLPARVGLVILVGGCASTNTSRVRVDAHPKPDVQGFGRVLVAGFLPDGVGQIDLNQETARFLRSQLRTKTSLGIIESDPLQLARVKRPGERGAEPLKAGMQRPSRDQRDSSDLQEDDAVFTDVPFWRTIGEEYSEPLILTGIVRFSPAGPRMVERQMGRRTMRFWLRGFSLRLRLVLISGRTGEIVDSVPLRQLTAHATTGRESALSIYFRLMDQSMPSILAVLGQETSQPRLLLR